MTCLHDHLHIFILAGGSGERFWPLSRSHTPKHLLRLLGDRTLLEETIARFEGVVPPERIFVLTNSRQIEACRAAAPNLPPEQFVSEPAKRDTAPAAALATGLARSRDPEAICALFPADAAIRNVEAFRRNLRDAASAAEEYDALLTFAIPPSSPSPRFGYLQLGETLSNGKEGTRILRVERFVEKPDVPTAEKYLESGQYAWNAGMFVWKAEIFLEECRRHVPELAAFILDMPGGDPSEYLKNHFSSLPKVSVDYAILEKASSVISASTSFDWDDVGSWTALPAHLGSDNEGNTFQGSVTSLDSEGNIAMSTGRTIALCGVKDLVIVETPDAVLVCHRDAVEDIKKLHPNLPDSLL